MLDFDYIDWDDPADLSGNTAHIEASGVTVDEVEEVLRDPRAQPTISRSSDRPALFGQTGSGKTIFIVYEIDDQGGVTVLRPITAYEVDLP